MLINVFVFFLILNGGAMIELTDLTDPVLSRIRQTPQKKESFAFRGQLSVRACIFVLDLLVDPLASLTRLELTDGVLDEKRLCFVVEGLERAGRRLQSLNLAGNDLGDDGCEKVLVALKDGRAKLVELCLASNGLESLSVALMCAWSEDLFPELEVLDLSGNKHFSNNQDVQINFENWCGKKAFPKLKLLDLTKCGLWRCNVSVAKI